MFQEFPKVLYRGEEHKVVFDAQEEKQFLALGYALTYGEPQEKAKRTRKVKNDNSTPDN